MTKPSSAFVAASWVGLLAGGITYCIGLFNSTTMVLSEKGFYFTILMYGIFSAVSLQKAVRDRLEGIKVTNIYMGIAWFSTLLAVFLLVVGLWNSTLLPSEKGFYAMSFLLALFAGVAVQKNIRDTSDSEELGN
jgi:uncharacterized membrane protein YiaA